MYVQFKFWENEQKFFYKKINIFVKKILLTNLIFNGFKKQNLNQIFTLNQILFLG